jgi:hypothetical protein
MSPSKIFKMESIPMIWLRKITERMNIIIKLKRFTVQMKGIY